MGSLYAFRCWTPRHPLPASTLVVFSGPNVFSDNDLTSAISEATQKSLSPEAVYLLYPEAAAAEAAKKVAEDAETFAPLTATQVIGLYGYDSEGRPTLHRALRGAPPNELPLEDIRRQGLTTLFKKRGGMIEAGPTSHFVKPSKQVDSRFLRASNALSEGAEIFFAAYWLLPYLHAGLRYVHVDTSAIASVVMAGLLMKGSSEVPIVSTFHSYEGLRQHNFSRDRDDLVLISASQSGNMSGEIAALVADPKQVLTMFSTAGADPRTIALCDLTFDAAKNADGFPAKRKIPDIFSSRPIKLISEQFMAQPEDVKGVVPETTKAPTVIRDFIARLQGQQVFVANRAGPGSSDAKAIWVDVEKLQQTAAFQEWVRKTARQDIPAATRAIIYSTMDSSSKALADALLREIGAIGGHLADVAVLTLTDIENAEEARWPNEAVPIVVTGGVTGHGTELQSISRALRSWAPNSHRIYLSSATIASSRRAFEFMKTNLSYPSHKFHSIFEIVLDRREAAGSWADERALLLDREDSLPDGLSERLDALNAEHVGLVDNLFLDGFKGPLTLRQNFAFWPEETDCAEASQADVFTSIACVLENMRSGEVPERLQLKNDAQARSVLSAQTFSRYNDGVIQAALLRAALPIELNYEDAPEHSRLLAELTMQMIDLVDRDQGEALTEFLMAMAVKRLKLSANHLESVRAKLTANASSLSDNQAWLARLL